MIRYPAILLLFAITLAAKAASVPTTTPLAQTTPLDKFGGSTAIRGTQSGFFHTQMIGNNWYLIDPAGNGFFILGMSMFEKESDSSRVSQDIKLFTDAGFNSFLGVGEHGATRPKVPYFILMNCSGGDFHHGDSAFNDVFSKRFEEQAISAIQHTCSTHINDTMLIGYFTDNELPWSQVWGGGFLDNYLSFPKVSAGFKQALSFVKDRYKSITAFNTDWDKRFKSWDGIGADTLKPGPNYNKIKVNEARDDFLFLVSQRYHSFIYQEIKNIDNNHMVLGNRFLTGDVSPAVARGMKDAVDVVSANCYAIRYFPYTFFETFSSITGVPVLLSAFGYSAKDANVPMDHPGADIPRIVETQEERAAKYQWYVEHAAMHKNIVGCVWWWHKDGFYDHNRGNFGFVTTDNKPYTVLFEKAKQVNGNAYNIHASSKTQFINVATTIYPVRITKPLKLDGNPDKYRMDIKLNERHRYQGYEFKESGLSANATMVHDNATLYVAVRVFDKQVITYKKKFILDSAYSIWEIDGVELRLGRYESLLYFNDTTASYIWTPTDPFPGIQIKGKLLPDGYFIEAKLPLKQLVDVINEKRIKFAIGVNDGQANERFRQLQFPMSFEWIYQESYGVGVLQ